MVDIAAVIQQGETDWTGSGAIMSTIIGNHDVTRFETASRAATRTGDTWTHGPAVDREASSTTSRSSRSPPIFTLPGAPVIYYGDEVGLAGRADPDSRRVYPTESQLSADQMRVRAATQKLGLARACDPTHCVAATTARSSSTPEHLVFSRTVSNGSTDASANGAAIGETAIVTLSRLPARTPSRSPFRGSPRASIRTSCPAPIGDTRS